MDSRCGAEINSLAHLRQDDFGEEVDLGIICLHYSGTEEGERVARMLAYALPRLFPGCWVELRRVKDLEARQVDRFRRQGLRALASGLAKDVRVYGSSRVILNATGGYKVMVAIAQALAQAAEIPIYYKFEFADQGMLVPPLPLSFDLPLWLRIADLLRYLKEEDVVRREDLDARILGLWGGGPDFGMDREKLNMLLEETQVRERKEPIRRLVSLSPLGELFREVGTWKFELLGASYLPAPAKSKRDLQYRKNEPGAEAFEAKFGIGEKLLELSYVSTCGVSYFNPDGRDLRRCHIDNLAQRQLEVEWGRGNGLIKYRVTVPTAVNSEQLGAVCEEIAGFLERW
jgi:putative CRISPR-associated protein (TIGR02619 family)